MRTGIVDALHSKARVVESTHTYYKHPARFSPEFARAIINEFTDPGDLIIDPFCGGGTTVVESLRAGRRVIGSDLNPLARFVTLGKSMPLGYHARKQAELVAAAIPKSKASILPIHNPAHYLKHVPEAAKPWAAKAIKTINRLSRSPKVARFSRLAVLRSAQLRLDARDELPTALDLTETYRKVVEAHIDLARSYYEELKNVWGRLPRFGDDYSVKEMRASHVGDAFQSAKPSLILTSPPYVGVHMLYHRWQIGGRRETPFPYLLAGEQDGQPESYYTMGSRSQAGINAYFTELRDTALAFRRLLSRDGTLAILVGFSDPLRMADDFIATFESVGFRRLENYHIPPTKLWREVPGRKWFAKQHSVSNASKELLILMH